METAIVDVGWLLLFLVTYFVVRSLRATLRSKSAERRLVLPLAAPVEFAGGALSDTAKIRLVRPRERW
jgi:hypothetical protein